MKDSEGGISALFYPGDRDPDHKTGDIIIDCGYSKLFDAMTSEGTSKYVQNIAAWTMQYKSRYLSMKNPESFRPDAINFEIDENVKFNGFIKAPEDAFASNASAAPLDPSQLSRRLFAIDYSGSVINATLYYDELYNIFRKYYRSGDTILIWDSVYEIICKSRMDNIIREKSGRGCTDPSLIASACASNSSIPREHLILVTDGGVDYGSIEKSDEILKQNNIQFQYVTSYIIGSGGDLSVGAPFARCCGSKTIEVRPDYRKEYENASSKDISSIQLIDRINTINQFNIQYSSLFNATKQRMIGRGCDDQLKSQFERMSQRINQSGNVNADVSRKMRGLIRMASGDIKNVFNIKEITVIGGGS